MAEEDQVSEPRARREDLSWVVRVRFAIRLFRVPADHMFPDERAICSVQVVDCLPSGEINVSTGYGCCRGDQTSQAKEARRRRLARREALWWHGHDRVIAVDLVFPNQCARSSIYRV